MDMVFEDIKWDNVFETENIDGKTRDECVAIGLMAWGNCTIGSKPPESFGRVMVLLAEKTGASTPDQYDEIADKILESGNA